MRAEVALLTRNIRIRGVMTRDCPTVNKNCQEFDFDTYGAHIKVNDGILVHFYSVSQIKVTVSEKESFRITEPRHEKTCLCHMRTTKAQISLRIRAV